MRVRALVVLAIGAAVLTAVLLVGVAVAGHTNTILNTDLDGREEVATDAGNRGLVGDPNGRGEVYVFGIDGDPKTLCYVLLVDKIQLVEPGMAAHIHEAAAGANGPIVVSLARPFDGNSADCLTEGEVLPNGTPVFAPGQTAADVLANPDDYYVNVHNAEYPGGAIRGQLESIH